MYIKLRRKRKRWYNSAGLPYRGYCQTWYTSRPRLLPCKVMEVLDGGWYRLGCSLGILDTHYQAADLEAVEAEYSELDNIPETTISLIAVIRRQSTDNESSGCNCKANCSTRRCPCRRADSTCGIDCHRTNNDCINH